MSITDVENWIFCVDDLLEFLEEGRAKARSLRQIAIIEAEIEDARSLKSFLLGYIEGSKGGKKA